MLEFGDTTLITQVAEPSTLPPPAPLNMQDQYADLQLLQNASEDVDNLHAVFHEVSLVGLHEHCQYKFPAYMSPFVRSLPMCSI